MSELTDLSDVVNDFLHDAIDNDGRLFSFGQDQAGLHPWLEDAYCTPLPLLKQPRVTFSENSAALLDAPPSSCCVPESEPGRANRLARKRENQRFYRERDKQQRVEANARLDELEAQLEELSAENSRLRLKSDALEILVRRLEHILDALKQDSGTEAAAAAAVPCASRVAYAHMSAVGTAVRMGISQFRTVWRDVVLHMASLLFEVEAGSVQAEKELYQSLEHIEHFLFNLTVIQPSLVSTLRTLNLDSGLPQQPEFEHWVKVIRCMRLSEEQQEQLLAVEHVTAGAAAQLDYVQCRLIHKIGSLSDDAHRGLLLLKQRLWGGQPPQQQHLQQQQMYHPLFMQQGMPMDGSSPFGSSPFGGSPFGSSAGRSGSIPPLHSPFAAPEWSTAPASATTGTTSTSDFPGVACRVLLPLEKVLQRKGLLDALSSTYIFSSVLQPRQKALAIVNAWPHVLASPELLAAWSSISGASSASSGDLHGSGSHSDGGGWGGACADMAQ